MLFTQGIQVNLITVCNQIALDLLTLCVNGFGNLFRCRPTVGNVVLDTEVAIGSGRVVTGRQNDTAKGFELADETGYCRRGKQAAPPDDHTSEAIGNRHAQDNLYRMTVVVTTIAAHDKCFILVTIDAVENRLNKVLQVILLLEHRHFLA